METPSFETTTQVFVGNHSMNIHIMSRLVSICFQRRRFNLKDNHDITEILLKVTLTTITPPNFFLKNMKLENILVVVEQQFGQP